jgi:hypothetical protein
MAIKDETCFVIGNGESRKIFGDLDRLKGFGTIYGCNAIYRDWPDLCDKIFAVNQPMYEELLEGKKEKNFKADIVGPNDISQWNYMVSGDAKNAMPFGLRIYRTWVGGDSKRNTWRTLDLSKARGSGMSAVLDAAEKGFKHIFVIAFDMLGAEQWKQDMGLASRKQNNIYKNTANYPERMNMKAYLKYEWMYQLCQISRQFHKSNFYLINRKEYIKGNNLLPHYIKYSKKNMYGTHYAQLQKFIENPRDPRSFFVWSLQP